MERWFIRGEESPQPPLVRGEADVAPLRNPPQPPLIRGEQNPWPRLIRGADFVHQGPPLS